MARKRTICIRQPEPIDEAWAVLAPHLPEPQASAKVGPKPALDRPVVEGILRVHRDGARWEALTEGDPACEGDAPGADAREGRGEAPQGVAVKPRKEGTTPRPRRRILGRGHDGDPPRARLAGRGIEMVCPHRQGPAEAGDAAGRPAGEIRPAAVADGAAVRLAGQLPPAAGPARADAADVPGILPRRMHAHHDAEVMKQPVPNRPGRKNKGLRLATQPLILASAEERT
jgi:hypothetical protein